MLISKLSNIFHETILIYYFEKYNKIDTYYYFFGKILIVGISVILLGVTFAFLPVNLSKIESGVKLSLKIPVK